MIKKLGILFLLSAVATVQATAQAKAKDKFAKRTSMEAGIALATDANQFSTGLSGVQFWGFGKKNRKFKIGLGVRLTSAIGGNNALYYTAPAILTSGKTGPGVFFAEQIETNIDTLTSESHNVNALNLLIALRYDITKKWGVEMNIDLAGISFGAHENLYFANPPIGSSLVKAGNGKPTSGNLLLISDNDLGTLNSEFLVTYKLNSKWKAKAGASFLFKEYTLGTPTKSASSTVSPNDRFRNKSLSPAIGINYIF